MQLNCDTKIKKYLLCNMNVRDALLLKKTVKKRALGAMLINFQSIGVFLKMSIKSQLLWQK